MIYQQKMWQSFVVVLILLAVSGYAFMYRLQMPVETPIPTDQQISNFEECANAGNPIMESFPRQCSHDRKTFVEGISYSDAGQEIKQSGAIEGTLKIGPFCPVEKKDVECPAPTMAYTSRIARLYDSSGEHMIEWRNISENGTFEFSPPEGNYFIDVYPGALNPVEKQSVQVLSGQKISITVFIDTGIR